MKKLIPLYIVALSVAASPAYSDAFAPGSSSSWWKQINLTSDIENSVNGASGFKLGIVDTGITLKNKEVTGRVSTTSTCVATGNCSSWVVDTNGHGTAVASIAAGSTATGGLMSGVAPKATIISIKIAQTNGSAYPSDLYNGIATAAQRGAQVINVSYGSFLTPASTPSYASYNSQLVSAINAAAAKGSIVVFAGGNSSTTFLSNLNQVGFSSAALSRMVFVGSVNSSNNLSWFSNTPGSSAFLNTSGATANLKSLWIMAPGENIVAPAIQYGATAYGYWTGTSMSAPIVAGALALLETKWPILASNGTATSVLFQSATDLGTAGVDSTYGHGLLNIAKAFEPIGALTVTQANGIVVPVTASSGGVLAGGAMGSLSALSSQLSQTTAFDDFQRDFTVDLSSAIVKKPVNGSAQTAAVAQASSVRSSAKFLPDGGVYSLVETQGPSQTMLESAKLASPLAALPQKSWIMAFSEADGFAAESGQGFSPAAAFADTLWGFGSNAAEGYHTLDASNALMGLTEGGRFVALGNKLGANSRYALSWSSTSLAQDSLGGQSWQTSNADALNAGVSWRMADLGERSSWDAGMTLGYLSEKSGLLGSLYDSKGLVSLGDQHHSYSVGVSSFLALGERTGLSFDAAVVRTEGGQISSGLVSGVSPMVARSYGVALTQRDLFGANDHVSLSARRPLRVVSGTADLVTASVDAQGYPVFGTTRVNLAPTGNQTDVSLGYGLPLTDRIDLSTATAFSQDYGHVRGDSNIQLSLGLKLKF
ncbi:MAG: S8 family peptidase [Bdellovibrionales bacterium]